MAKGKVAAPAKEVKIAAAAGVAGGGGEVDLGRKLEEAMGKAVEDAAKAGITDPDKVRELMAKAREQVKADARKSTEV